MKCIKDSIQNCNIVVGCTIGCSYCYARNNVRRFHTTKDFNELVYFENKLKILERKKPRNLFLTGMSDLSLWKDEWIEDIFDTMARNVQHQYIFLTKRPEDFSMHCTLDNAWFGVTVTSSKEKGRIQALKNNIKAKHYHVTFEPMFDDVGELDLKGIDWIVVGTETGNRKGKSVSQVSWIYNIVNQAKKYNIPVFMKEDLLGIIGEEDLIQEFPKEFDDVLKEQANYGK